MNIFQVFSSIKNIFTAIKFSLFLVVIILFATYFIYRYEVSRVLREVKRGELIKTDLQRQKNIRRF